MYSSGITHASLSIITVASLLLYGPPIPSNCLWKVKKSRSRLLFGGEQSGGVGEKVERWSFVATFVIHTLPSPCYRTPRPPPPAGTTFYLYF